MDFSRKKLLFMSIIVLMMILLSNIFGYVNESYSAKSGITTANVNFRKNTSINSSSRIKTLANNTEVQIVGDIDNFYISILKSGEVGLISKDYSKMIEQNYTGFYTYVDLENFYATVNDNNTNLRGGPSTSYIVYTKLNAGDKVEIIGKIDNFYLVVTDNNYVGMIREDLVTKISENSENQSQITPSTMPNTPETVLTLINKVRNDNGLPSLQIDELLNSTAQTKANDMVENIVSNAYNYIGIGVKPSDTYGYVIVTMFIGK